MKKFLLLFTIFFYSTAYSEINLRNVLEKTINFNPKLNASKANLEAIKQNYGISRSEFLPTIELSQDVISTQSTNKTDSSGASISDSSLDSEKTSVSVEQKIFQGFKGINSLRKSNFEIKKAEYQLKDIEQDTVIRAAEVYFDLINKLESRNFNKENRDLLERQVEFDKARVQKGEITLTDLAQSESSLSGANAKLISSENDLLSAKSNFQQVTGLIAVENLPKDLNLDLKIPKSLSESVILASKNNPKLLISKMDYSIASKNHDIEKSKLSPEASLNYSKSQNNEFSSTVDEVDKESVQATIKWPIIKGGKNFHSLKKTRYEKERYKLLFENQENVIRTQTNNIWATYKSSISILEATNSQLKAAQIANEGITLEYDSGNTRSTLEVIQSRSLLLDAKINNSKAERNLIISKFKLLAHLGNLSFSNIVN